MKLITRSPLVFRLLRVAAWLCARFRASCLASSPVLSLSLVDVAADPNGRDLAGSSARLGSEWIGSRFGPAAAVTDAPLSPSSGALEVLANPWRTPDQLLAGEPMENLLYVLPAVQINFTVHVRCIFAAVLEKTTFNPLR